MGGFWCVGEGVWIVSVGMTSGEGASTLMMISGVDFSGAD